MQEDSLIKQSLAVSVRGIDGRIKAERYVKDGAEFVPNRFYIYLRNRGLIKSDTFKIPILLGTTKQRG